MMLHHWFILFISISTAAYAQHVLRGANKLTYDHTKPKLPTIMLDNISFQSNTQQSISLASFARMPLIVKLPDSIDQSKLNLRLNVSVHPILPTDGPPVLFIHGVRFGGDDRVAFDTSSFCEWLEGKSGLVVHLPSASGRTPPKNRQGYTIQDLILYVGFNSGIRSRELREVKINAILEQRNETSSDQDICERLRAPSAMSVLHAHTKYVWATEYMIGDWSHIDSIDGLQRAIRISKKVVGSIVLDMPHLHLGRDWPALLIDTNIQPKDLAILVGPFSARSVWELTRIDPVPINNSSSLVVHLFQLIQDMKRSRSLFSPPGLSLSILIFSLTEEEIELKIRPIMDPRQSEIFVPKLRQALLNDTPESNKSSWLRESLIDCLALIGLAVMGHGCYEVVKRMNETGNRFIGVPSHRFEEREVQLKQENIGTTNKVEENQRLL